MDSSIYVMLSLLPVITGIFVGYFASKENKLRNSLAWACAGALLTLVYINFDAIALSPAFPVFLFASPLIAFLIGYRSSKTHPGTMGLILSAIALILGFIMFMHLAMLSMGVHG